MKHKLYFWLRYINNMYFYLETMLQSKIFFVKQENVKNPKNLKFKTIKTKEENLHIF